MSERLAKILAEQPVTDFEVTLDRDRFDAYWRDGFTSIERITTDEEMAWIGELYDLMFQEKLSGVPGGYFDLSRPYDATGADQVPQILHPEKVVPSLCETAFFKNTRRIGSALLEVPVEKIDSWGHMILKPPHTPVELPWHQDEAYWHPGFDYKALGVWFPLGGASAEGGCLSFIPGSHRQHVREHGHISDDPAVHGLYTWDVDDTEAVCVPLAPGGVTVHHCRTLHKSGGNLTDRPRRAIAVEQQLEPVKREVMYDRPWVLEGAKAWRERGPEARKAHQGKK